MNSIPHSVKVSGLLVALLLSGCKTVPLVYTPVTPSLPAVPDEWVTPCVAPTPPHPVTYLEESMTGRENLLIEYHIALLMELKRCDLKVASLRDWYQALLSTYE